MQCNHLGDLFQRSKGATYSTWHYETSRHPSLHQSCLGRQKLNFSNMSRTYGIDAPYSDQATDTASHYGISKHYDPSLLSDRSQVMVDQVNRMISRMSGAKHIFRTRHRPAYDSEITKYPQA